jgi:hypothetical protein
MNDVLFDKYRKKGIKKPRFQRGFPKLIIIKYSYLKIYLRV